jgi:phage shock protein PspC (stress-responsive transcriptional regulator)
METQQTTQHQHQERPRLERLRSDRVIAGVASGFARHLGIDAAWVRIGFVVTTLFGGAGFLAYLVAWLAIPEEGESDSVLTTRARHTPNIGSWVGIGLIVLAGLILVGNTGLVDGEIVFAGGLIALGILLYRGDIGSGSDRGSDDGPDRGSDDWPDSGSDHRSDRRSDRDDESPQATRHMPPVPVYSSPMTAHGVATEIPPTPPPPAEPLPPAPAFQPKPPKPRTPPSPLGRLTMATLLIVIGVMGVGQSAGWWDPLARHYAGAVLVILGAGLVTGTLFGRARWLIAVGLVSAPFLFAGALLDVPLDGGFGDPRYSPDSVAQLEPEYRLIGGEMILDLSNLELEAGDSYEVDASVAFGRLEVRIPDGVGVNVTAEVNGGEITIDGERVNEGINLDENVIYEGTGMIDLDLHVGFGEMNVREVER